MRGESDWNAYRHRLAYLHDRIAELRDEIRCVAEDYRQGHLSLREEVALLTDMNAEVISLVAECVALTRAPALSRQGE